MFRFTLVISFFLLNTPLHCLALKNVIYIYDGPGASNESVQQTFSTIEAYASPPQVVKLIGPQQIIQGGWVEDAVLLVMPGGADLPYCEKLNNEGNEKIISYVRNGGSYLGICAGAYYGSHTIEFAEGTPMEIIGERELGFFPGLAIGPALATYDYQSNSGVRAANISQENLPNFNVYYNGGGYFSHPEQFDNVRIVSSYASEIAPRAAVIMSNIGKGRAILSGVHFEYDPKLLDPQDPDISTILPSLEATQGGRMKYVKYILGLLGVFTN